MVGENHDSPRAAEYTIREEYNVEEKHRGNDLLSSSSPTRGGGYKMEATTSLSLTLCYTLCTTHFTIINNDLKYVP